MGQSCERVTRITAVSESKVIDVQVDTEAGSQLVLRYRIQMKRVAEVQAPHAGAGRLSCTWRCPLPRAITTLTWTPCNNSAENCTRQSMSFAIRNRFLSWLVAMLPAITLPATAGAADATAAADTTAAPVEEEVVLDEVLVRGKRLEQRIVEAENAFYQLYNQLNKNDKYDMSCPELNIDPDNRNSRITTRVCLPGFVADAMVDWTVFKVRCQPPLEDFDEFSCLDKNDDQRLSRQEVAMRPELDVQMMRLDADFNGYLTRDEMPPEGMGGLPAPYQPPPPQLVLMEGTKAWYEHMMQVTRSDPRLLEMAGRLDDLHREYMTLARQEAELRRRDHAERAQRVGEYNRGPRGR